MLFSKNSKSNHELTFFLKHVKKQLKSADFFSRKRSENFEFFSYLVTIGDYRVQ